MKILILSLFCLLSCLTWAQTKNTSTEVRDYREVDGKIILDLVVNGEVAGFVLDLAGHTAILPEYVERLKIDENIPGEFKYNEFLYKKVPVVKSVLIGTIAFGNNVFGNGVSAFVLGDESYLRELGVAGAMFRNVVLTIDRRRKKITTSIPYRPSYMKLDYRTDMEVLPGSTVVCPVTINGTVYSLLFDTWNDGMISMTAEDFARIDGTDGGVAFVMNGYVKITKTKTAVVCDFVKDQLGSVVVAENKELPRSVLGSGILEKGIISIDYQKQKIYFQSFDLVEVKDDVVGDVTSSVVPGKLNPITREYFLEHIYDYRKDKEFVFKGDKPVVIDFWATWCGPCCREIPHLREAYAACKSKGLEIYGVSLDNDAAKWRTFVADNDMPWINVLGVNADKRSDAAAMYGISSIPANFLISPEGIIVARDLRGENIKARLEEAMR